MYRLYDLLVMLAGALLLPKYWLRALRGGKSRRGVRERLGFLESEQIAMLAGRKVIWIHAVSVGETRSIAPLITGLKQRYPDCRVVLSQTTETGREVARSLHEVDLCLFFPLDTTPVVRRVLSALNPQAILFVERELWPNLTRLAAARGIPLLLVNGRLSARSCSRYRMISGLMGSVLRRFYGFCMQSPEDARRIQQLGAPVERVRICGNLKFDIAVEPPTSQVRQDWAESFGLGGDVPVWVAGSTHNGEEETVLRAFSQLLAAGHSLRLVLAPRHPERTRAVAELLQRHQLPFWRRSQQADPPVPLAAGQVLLVDGVGEMLRCYALARVVFVGGSLVPVGGHNILEAAALVKPVLFGPYMGNAPGVAQLVEESGAGFRVADAVQLYQRLDSLLTDSEQRQACAQAAQELMNRHRGATGRSLDLIHAALPD